MQAFGLWDKIKYNIQTINVGKSGESNSIKCNSVEYDKDYMRIEFNSDHDLPLNKMLNNIIKSYANNSCQICF